jgi:hypothetical protein
MLKKSGVQDNNNNDKDAAVAQQSWSCGLISLKRQEVFGGEWALSVPVDFGWVCGESVSFSLPCSFFACVLTVLMISELSGSCVIDRDRWGIVETPPSLVFLPPAHSFLHLYSASVVHAVSQRDENERATEIKRRELPKEIDPVLDIEVFYISDYV